MSKLPNKFNITMPAMYGFPENTASVVYDPNNFVYIIKDKSGKIAKMGEKELRVKIDNGEYMIDEYKMPNLKETYNRLFGELPEEDRVGRSVSKPAAKQVINEVQMKSWLHLHKTFKTQYPGRSLAMTEGVIKLDGHIVESAETFLKRDLGSMVQVLKATHQKIKGLGQ